MNNKGLSQVVTTVLIILIVLAAVVIIWAFVRPTITEAGEQITSDCLTLDLEVLSCTNNTNNVDLDVTVRRNAGAGDLTGVRIILADGTIFDNSSLTELQSKTFVLGGAAGISSVNVAPLVGENQRVCNPQYEATVCS
jgi:hypothetical protein